MVNLGWDKDALAQQAKDLLATGKIDAILAEKAKAYAERRPSVKGLFEGAPEAIGNSMFWNTVYAPSLDSIFPEYQPSVGDMVGAAGWSVNGIAFSALFSRAWKKASKPWQRLKQSCWHRRKTV